MTHHSHTMFIPLNLRTLASRQEFILWLASYNLPPDDAYRTYKSWCDYVGTEVNRRDLDDLAGTDYNVN